MASSPARPAALLARCLLGLVAASVSGAEPGRATVVVGIDRDFPPYEFVDETGTPSGFDVELVREVAAAAGIQVVFEASHGAELAASLEAGRFQALAGAFHFEALDHTLAFGEPYVGVEFAIFGRTGAAELSGIEDLKGKEVLVNQGDVVEEWLRGRGAPFRVVAANSPDDTLRRLAAGQGDYAVMARLEGTLVAGRLKLANVVASPVPIFLRNYCFAVKQGDARLLADLTRGLAEVRKSGEYDRLDRKWFALLQPQRSTLVWVFRHGAFFLVPLLLVLVAVVTWSQTLARRVASRTRLLREELAERRRSQETQAAIYEISEAAQAAENLDELFARLHRVVGRLMPATNFYIALHDAESDLLSFPYFVDEEDERPEPFKPGRGLTGYVLRTGEPLLATDEGIAALERQGELQSLGAPSVDWLGVPLRVRERTIGVLAIQSYTGKVRYTEADLQILSYVSNQAGQAIERKRAEQELKESQRKLFTLMGNLPGMAYRCANDPHWTFEFVSDGCFDLTGYHPGDLVGNSGVKLCVAEDLEEVNRKVDEAFAQRRAFELTYRILTATGETKWVWERGRGVFSPAGDLVALEGFIADISERKAAEEALRRSEERYRLALQATQEIMYDWDVPADTIIWNPNVRKVLGYTAEEMGGTFEAWAGFIHPADADRVRAELAAAVAGGEAFTSEYRFLRKKGDYAVLLDRGLIIRDLEGRATRMVGAMTDLTDRKRLEDQLRQAQKIEAVGKLAGGIAHDFNNLLTAVRGATELLQRRLGSDQQAQQELATIHGAALRAAEFTKGLLAFARRQVLEPVNLDLNVFISDALPMLRHLIPENIRIEFQPFAGLETIRVDRGQLTQILMNLCVNARDAMPSGGTISVSTANVPMDQAFVATHAGAREGRYACLAVADTGVGIDREDLAKIFEPFFTTKDTGKGTGLGLSTVYGIVKQHDGFVYADSGPGSGSTFRVYLPVTSVEGGPSVQPPEAAVRGGDEMILVVEDETEVRTILVDALRGFGYRVHEAGDGSEGLEMLQRGLRPDLVLTDMVMPRMGGMDLCIAARATQPTLKFLFSSGYTEDSVHVGFIKKKGVFFLAKPYGIDTLGRKVREVLESPPRATDASSD
ncbi:MAG: PAS domain-containing protein [Thermoanaerobaculaceae bacterium]|jgi:PAS domain S-box-containing protein